MKLNTFFSIVLSATLTVRMRNFEQHVIFEKELKFHTDGSVLIRDLN